MAFFRRPKTNNERKKDGALKSGPTLEDGQALRVKARLRSARKEGDGGLPSAWSDLVASTKKHRAHGKKSHSKARKAKAKQRNALF